MSARIILKEYKNRVICPGSLKTTRNFFVYFSDNYFFSLDLVVEIWV